MAGQPVSGPPSNGQATAALSSPKSKPPPLPLPKTNGPMANPLPKAKSVRLVTLLNSHSLDAEYPDGATITFDATSGFRKLVSGQPPSRPLAAEIKRFQQDIAEAAKKDYAIDAFMKANPNLVLDYDTIWEQAIDRNIFPNTTSVSSRHSDCSLAPYPVTPFRGKVPLNKADPLGTQGNAVQKPGQVQVVPGLDSFAIEKDYGAYIIRYGHSSGFGKYNKATSRSVQANDAEIRVFQKDVNEALKLKDAAVEAFVKDNPRVLKS